MLDEKSLFITDEAVIKDDRLKAGMVEYKPNNYWVKNDRLFG